MKIRNAGDRVVNTWLYPVEDGYVMVDTGYEHSYEKVLRRLEKMGVAPGDIRYLFLTHAHDDHAGFLEELMAAHPHIRVVAHEQAIPGLRRGQNSFDGGCSGIPAFLFCQLMALLGKGEHRYPKLSEEQLGAIITVNDGNIAQIEKSLNGKILFTPGHTEDSIALLVNGSLFCGDAAMNGIPSRHKITIWVEDKAKFARSWEEMLASPADMIYPAHGRPFKPEKLRENLRHVSGVKLYPLAHK